MATILSSVTTERTASASPDRAASWPPFVVGAYAARHNHLLLTLDEGVYRAAFPALRILRA